MFVCPNCNNKTELPSKFCSNCGSPMVEQAPEYQEPQYQEPQYQQAQYQQPQYQYQQPASPVSKGKVIAGMAISIAGLAFSALGLMYTLAMMAEPFGAFVMGFVFSMFSLPLSLVGLCLSNGCYNEGDRSAMSSVGRKLGLVGTILSGVMIFLAFIALIAESA